MRENLSVKPLQINYALIIKQTYYFEIAKQIN